MLATLTSLHCIKISLFFRHSFMYPLIFLIGGAPIGTIKQTPSSCTKPVSKTYDLKDITEIYASLSDNNTAILIHWRTLRIHMMFFVIASMNTFQTIHPTVELGFLAEKLF